MASTIQYDGKVITVPSLPLLYDKGVGELVFDLMQKNKEYVAQIDGISGKKDTYESLLQRCIRTAITMRSRGVTSEDIISVCSFNHLDVHVPVIASMFLGVKFASIDPSFTLEDTAHLLQQIQPKMIFVSPNAVKNIEVALKLIDTKTEIVVFGETEIHSPFKNFLKQSPEEDSFKPREIENLKETFAIFFSSGTTGLPKGICLSHLMVLGVIPSFCDAKARMRGVILTYASLYWISSFFFLILAVETGSARVIMPGFDVSSLWSYVEKCKVNLLFLSVNQIATVLSEKRPENNLSSLKFLLSGGSNVSREQIDALRQFLPGVFIIVSYGQTEIGGALGFKPSVNPEDFKLMLEKPESCGRPIPGYSYKIVDPATEEVLGVNQKGELRVKTEYQLNGYYNVDSSSAWDSEGYMKTGDIAYYEEHFRFFIVDRIKEIFKFRSFQVIPSKLEALLRTHPAVENALVFGVPHPVDIHHPTALAILKPGAKTSSEEIRDFLDAKVGDPQRLRGGVKIVDSIPETPSGKFKRNYTRDLFVQGKLRCL